VCDVVFHRGCTILSPLVILISGKFLSTICELMQRAINCVQNWCGEIGLNVNADKTSMVLFTKRRNFKGFFAPIGVGKISGSHFR
jgi:hypothetical protein